MADLSNSSWSETDSNNSQPSPDGFPSGILPSQVGGVIRAMRGAVKRSYDRSNAMIVSTGSTADNTYILTYEQPPTAYTKGEVFRFFANFTNNAAALININGLGPKNLMRADGGALSGGELVAGQVVTAIYDGTNFLHQSTGTRNFKDNVSITVNSDAILQIESTAAPANSFRMKQIYSSANVNGGNDWLFRQRRPSDGATEDFTLKTGTAGTIWTTGNFDPNTRVAVAGGSTITGQTNVAANVALHFNSIAADANDGKIGTGLFGPGLNIVGAATVSGDTKRYLNMWGNLTMNGGSLTLTAGDITTNGRVIVGAGQTSSIIEMRDTDEGTRYVHNNSGTIGFLGSDSNWITRMYDSGAIWSKQMGDLSTYIVNTSNTAASNYAVQRVAKTGDTMSGSIVMAGDLGGYTPGIKFSMSGNDWFMRGIGGNRVQFCDQGMTVEYLSFGADGTISTRQFGDLNNRIEARGQAWGQWAVNQCATSMRLPYAGDLYNSWNLNGGMAEPYGGSMMSSRATVADGTANGAWIPGIFRWRYVQFYTPNAGWVTAYYA